MKIAVILSALASAAGVLVAADAHANLYWTPWVSEENGGPWTACTAWNEAAIGFGCSGSYCDNIRMECQTFYNGLTLNPSTDKWTHWFSEETPPPSDIGTTSTDPPMNAGVCQYGIGIDAVIPGVMTGAHCTGKYCDNMQLECDQPVKYNGATPVPSIATNCQTYGPYSEENGSQDFGAGRFVSAISCSGKYCDNLTFTVCSFPAPF